MIIFLWVCLIILLIPSIIFLYRIWGIVRAVYWKTRPLYVKSACGITMPPKCKKLIKCTPINDGCWAIEYKTLGKSEYGCDIYVKQTKIVKAEDFYYEI